MQVRVILVDNRYMRDGRSSRQLGFHAMAMIATAIGAVAVGAFAIGALTVRRLTIRRVLIESAEFKSLKIQDLTVARLRAAEVTVSDSLRLPEAMSAPGPRDERSPVVSEV